MTSAPTRSQRLFAVLGFLAVAGLTAGAFVLSYDALRLLALAGLEGDNAERFGRYYPMVYDGLVAVALLAVFVARHSSWWVRWTRWLVLVALVGGGIAASVQQAVKGFEPIEGTALEAGVASAPWVAALLAIWLWMSMLRQVREGSRQVRESPRQRRADRRHTPAHAKRTNDAPALIPGLVEDRPESQTDPLPLPTAEDLPEAYREPVELVEPVETAPAETGPAEPRDQEEAAETGPWDSPWPDGVREDLGEEPEPARPPLTLPTDVKLVGRGEEGEEPGKPGRDEDVPASTTQPDFPVPGRRPEPRRAEDSEDSDAGGTGEDWIGYSPEHNPPSGSFRSAPLPPEKG